MKYRNIYKSLILATFLLGTSACDIDTEPIDHYSEITEGQHNIDNGIAFKDKAAVMDYLNHIYRVMCDRQEHWYLDYLLLGDSHSDNAYGGAPGAEVMPFEDNSIEGSNNVISRDWARYLEDIGMVNKLICNIDAVKDNTFSDSERNSVKGQALIFRALMLFDMERIWGNIPVITTSAGDVTANNIDDVYQSYFPSQKTPLEAYTQIAKDLTEGLMYAPENNPSNKTILSKSVARALLAKVYAEKPIRDYAKVIQYCDELKAEGFGLVEDLSDLFGMNFDGSDIKMRNTKESILEMQFFTGSGNWVTWMFGRDLLNWENQFTWSKWVTPSRDLINAYDECGDTKRKNESIVFYECNWSNCYPSDNYAFMYKCRSANSSIIKLRYADILLLKAEAYLYGNEVNTEAAADIIDQIRERAGVKPISASTRSNLEALKKAYLNERRMELAFEGQRWYDLCRLNLVEEYMNSIHSKDEGRNALKYQYNENSYYLPVPQDALDQNPNLVQNPGY